MLPFPSELQAISDQFVDVWIHCAKDEANPPLLRVLYLHLMRVFPRRETHLDQECYEEARDLLDGLHLSGSEEIDRAMLSGRVALFFQQQKIAAMRRSLFDLFFKRLGEAPYNFKVGFNESTFYFVAEDANALDESLAEFWGDDMLPSECINEDPRDASHHCLTECGMACLGESFCLDQWEAFRKEALAADANRVDDDIVLWEPPLVLELRSVYREVMLAFARDKANSSYARGYAYLTVLQLLCEKDCAQGIIFFNEALVLLRDKRKGNTSRLRRLLEDEFAELARAFLSFKDQLPTRRYSSAHLVVKVEQYPSILQAAKEALKQTQAQAPLHRRARRVQFFDALNCPVREAYSPRGDSYMELVGWEDNSQIDQAQAASSSTLVMATPTPTPTL